MPIHGHRRQMKMSGVPLCHPLPVPWRQDLSLSLEPAFSQVGWKPASPGFSFLCFPQSWGGGSPDC